MDKKIIIVSLVVLAVGGGAFFGGIKYQESKSQNQIPSAGNFRQIPGGGQLSDGARANRNVGGGMVAGEIIGVDEDSIILKSADGSSKIVFFSEKTSIGNFVVAQAGDLAVGQYVSAAGTAGADGSIVANNIQIGTANRGEFQRPQEENTAQPAM